MTPLVSVITPTWQRHDLLLDRCIPSVQEQDYPAVEHVVVSDGPDPQLDAKIKEKQFASIFSQDVTVPVRFFQLDAHDPAYRWGHRARLEGIRQARGALIAWLDDDNAFRPHHVSRLGAALAVTGPGAPGFAYSQIVMHGHGSPYTVGATPPSCGQIDTSAIMHRRGLLDVATWRDEGQQTNEWDLVERWMGAGTSWAFVHEITADYYFADAAGLGRPPVWTLQATGDCPPADERVLRDLIAGVLSDPRFGTTASQLGGAAHNGPVHDPPPRASRRKADG